MRSVIDTFAIRDACKLLGNWDKSFGHDNGVAILDHWQHESFAKSFKSLTEETNVHRALLQSFMREIEPFDCLLIAGWQPAENQLSKVIAALFSQNWGHRFGSTILQRLLDAITRNCSLPPGKRDLVKQIRHTIDPNRTQIFVRREHWGDSSRADIDIYTRGIDGFLVRIEHKIRGRGETFIAGKQQTLRLWKDAITRAEILGINPERVIGIFLNPGGESATSRDFSVLSFRDFADAVSAAVTDEQQRR